MSNCLVCHEEVNNSFGWSEFLGVSKEKKLCSDCKDSFLPITGDICRICGRIWAKVAKEHRCGAICADCQKWEEDQDSQGLLHMNRSIYQYNEQMKEVLARYKFRGDAVLASVFQQEFQGAFDLFYKNESLLLVPIPLGEDRLYERGFNQSLLLAELLRGKIAEPLSKSETEKQSKKARHARLQRENSFYVSNSAGIVGKNILLIDDIYTTGTTLRMAAQRLKEAGAGKISSLTLVRS